MKLSEKQIEDVFEQFYKELISKEIIFKGRQVKFNNLRADLYFEDKKGKPIIVEIKKDTVSREDIGQLLQYAGTVKDCNVILIAPFIPPSIKNAFEHYGIDYREFSPSKIEELYDQIKALQTKRPSEKPVIPIVRDEYIKMPDKKHDGNIAFKVTYNDKNWSGICSPDVFKLNSAGRQKMYWCSYQAPQCQELKDKDLNIDYYPCYDVIANLTTSFSPGWNHGKDRPYECKEAKVGKIALLTSLIPGERQDQRLIFTIFEIAKITVVDDPENDYAGTEFYHGDLKTAIKFDKNQYMNYWDYTINKTDNPKFQTFWGAGLFRYVDDKIIRNILNDIISNSKFTTLQKRNAEKLLINVS